MKALMLCLRLAIIVVISIYFKPLYGQNKINSRLYFLPIGMKVSTGDVQEFGLGIYEFKYTTPLNIELGCIFSKKVIKNLFVDAGIGLKANKLKIEYSIDDPYIEGEIFGREKRYLNKIELSPQLSLNYNVEKIYFSIGYETSLKISYNSNLVSGISPTYVFFDPIGQRNAFFTIRETNFFLEGLRLHHRLVANIGYRLNEKWHLNLNFKYKPFTNWFQYGLLIEGKTPDMPEGNYILNDTRILNKLMLVSFGISYSLN